MQEKETAKLDTLLLSWYAANARDLPWRKDKEPYHVWLSEIMLQQTRVEAVKPYYLRFLRELPTIYALSHCEEDKLLKLWEGLGYYSRVRNLAKAARTVMDEYGGVFPHTYEEIKQLSGIGDYTAGAIASICFELPEPAVDGNVLRVMTRLFADDGCIDDADVKKRIRTQLKEIYQTCTQRGMLTQALMELGATVCVPNGAPHCEECPCCSICKAYRSSTTADYPVRKEKKARRIEYYTVYTLLCGDRIAVRKRPSKGLLAGLWELPHLDGMRDAQEALTAAADELHCTPRDIFTVTEKVHIFTHIEWHMRCVFLECAEMPQEFEWVTKEALDAETPLPTAFRICLPDFEKDTERMISTRRGGKNMAWVIRTAAAKDIDALVAMRLTQLRDEGKEATCDIREALYSYFKEVVVTGSQSCFVAIEQERVIAMASISYFAKPPYYSNPTGKLGMVNGVYTMPEYRRMGIASALLRKLMRTAKERGCGELYVAASDEGVLLYESLGFTKNDNFRRIALT